MKLNPERGLESTTTKLNASKPCDGLRGYLFMTSTGTKPNLGDFLLFLQQQCHLETALESLDPSIFYGYQALVVSQIKSSSSPSTSFPQRVSFAQACQGRVQNLGRVLGSRPVYSL